jgi:hypothetical protein
MNMFLRVSRKLRNVALKFYRVWLPCRLKTVPNAELDIYRQETKAATLYLNPEYDIL